MKSKIFKGEKERDKSKSKGPKVHKSKFIEYFQPIVRKKQKL